MVSYLCNPCARCWFASPVYYFLIFFFRILILAKMSTRENNPSNYGQVMVHSDVRDVYRDGIVGLELFIKLFKKFQI